MAETSRNLHVESIPNPPVTYDVKIDPSLNEARRKYLTNHQFELKLSSKLLQESGIVDAFSRLTEEMEGKQQEIGPNFLEMRYGETPSMTYYFDREEFSPRGHDSITYGRSKGVRAIVHPKGRVEIQVLASKYNTNEDIPLIVSESGWVAVVSEDKDIYTQLREASKLSSPYHDLRSSDEHGELTGFPEHNSHAVEVKFDTIKQQMMVR